MEFSIIREFDTALRELRTLPNTAFKEDLENLARAANANMTRYHSDNPCTCSEECKSKSLHGFNSAIARYFIRCAAAAKIQENVKQKNLYLEIANKLNLL